MISEMKNIHRRIDKNQSTGGGWIQLFNLEGRRARELFSNGHRRSIMAGNTFHDN